GVGGYNQSGLARLVAMQHRVCNPVPSEYLLNRGAAVAAHPARPLEIGEEGADAPADRIGGSLNLQAIDVVPNELLRAAVFGGDHRLACGPTFEGADAEGLVAAGE